LVPSNSNESKAAIFITFSIPFYFLAEHFVKKHSFYRHGIEEALSLVAMVLFCYGCLSLFNCWKGYRFDYQLINIIICTLFAITAYWIHLRFGFLYALLISIVALGAIPFQFSLSETAERGLLFLFLCVIICISLIKDKSEIYDFQKEKNTIVQACLLTGIYLTVNLRLPELITVHLDKSIMPLKPYAGVAPYIYWGSYILTFLIPIAGICWGFKSRKRFIINISLVAAFLTLSTNKDYLGLKHNAWDPAIMGIMLILISVFVTRWLSKGLNKRKYGLTAENILKRESHGINLVDIGAALTPGFIASQQPAPPTDKFFEGGKSGGGGASVNY
jgi:hypothetical protein